MAEAEGTALCRADEIADGAARGFVIGSPRQNLFVARKGDALFAYWNSCPHVGTPLEWTDDEFFDVERRHLLCSSHGALFRVEDGVCLVGPCQGDRLEPYPIEIRDGVVYALSDFAT
jgi:nitrite reductase/ring-hydroxylating ferredoxin subunit